MNDDQDQGEKTSALVGTNLVDKPNNAELIQGKLSCMSAWEIHLLSMTGAESLEEARELTLNLG